MAAGQLEDFVPQPLLPEAVKHLLRIYRQEGRIVARPNQEGREPPSGEPIEVTRGADYGPVPPEIVLTHMTLKTLPDILRGQTGPDHVREVHGDVIEDSGADPRIVRRRDK